MAFLLLQLFAEEKRACCFTFIVFLLSCGSLCSVFLPRGIVGCSVAGSIILACPGPKVIKLEFILKLKIKRNDWLLADTCLQATNRCALF